MHTYVLKDANDPGWSLVLRLKDFKTFHDNIMLGKNRQLSPRVGGLYLFRVVEYASHSAKRILEEFGVDIPDFVLETKVRNMQVEHDVRKDKERRERMAFEAKEAKKAEKRRLKQEGLC
jgi:hypothetical protein